MTGRSGQVVRRPYRGSHYLVQITMEDWLAIIDREKRMRDESEGGCDGDKDSEQAQLITFWMDTFQSKISESETLTHCRL